MARQETARCTNKKGGMQLHSDVDEKYNAGDHVEPYFAWELAERVARPTQVRRNPEGQFVRHFNHDVENKGQGEELPRDHDPVAAQQPRRKRGMRSAPWQHWVKQSTRVVWNFRVFLTDWAGRDCILSRALCISSVQTLRSFVGTRLCTIVCSEGAAQGVEGCGARSKHVLGSSSCS